jgi:predicted metalloprotease with PDZ domain
MRNLLCLAVLAVAHAHAEDSDRFSWATAPVGGAGITLAVDATELPTQGLVYTREWVAGPNLDMLVYPLWVPGAHAPCGPAENIGGITVCDEQGRPLPWTHDLLDQWEIHVQAGHAERVRIDLTYIANQPTVNSDGVDVVGTQRCGIINWNCLLFYPKDAAIGTLPCAASLRLPAGWAQASALEVDASADQVVRFKPSTLSGTIDSPVLCGPVITRIPLGAAGKSPVTLDVVASSDKSYTLDEAALAALRSLPEEASLLFGGPWFRRYDMLLVFGSYSFGLEHGACALVGLGPQDLDNRDDVGSREVMPHEFTHSWNGKHRRPLGMLTPTYQEHPDLEDLWVYEGLTEFLGRVLAVRCGLLTAEDWRASILYDIQNLEKATGRSWRTVRDTCVCSYQLRAPSQNHDDLRRDQDYYSEGALFWLVVDHRLREASKGAVSIDDFCRAFLGPQGAQKQGYTEAELVAALRALAPIDWAGLIASWMDRTGPLDTAAILGHSGWARQRTVVDKADECELESVDDAALYAALECTIVQGTVQAVTADGVSAKAGLKVGDSISAVDGKELHAERHWFERAVAGATAASPLAMVVQRQGAQKQLSIVPKPLVIEVLTREAGVDDEMAPLLAPRRQPRSPTP